MNERLCLFESLSEGNETGNSKDDFEKIFEGNYSEILESTAFKSFLATGCDDFTSELKFSISVACLLAFVQENFTGPDIYETSDFIQFKTIADEKWNFSRISVDGIEINENIRNVGLLLIAKNFFEEILEKNPSDLLIAVWYMRVLKTLQKSLDENSITLYEKFIKLHKERFTTEALNEIKDLRHRLLINLEIISIYLMYRRVKVVEELLKNLKETYQIEIFEEGILGMRTKWQQKALPQFHVSIQQSNPEISVEAARTHSDTKLLELLKLEDDTRLEEVKFLDEKHNELQKLSSVMQNLIMLNIRYLEISQPKDKLSVEEIRPYMMLLLKQTNGPWIIRIDALLDIIKLESDHKRTIDRCLRQCEELVNFINAKNETLPRHRLSYVFSSLMTPRYRIEKLLADLMVSLGLVKGALDIYLRVHQWEDVINCFTTLQLRHKAAEIIQQQLEKQPTVKLYCLLGDATDDVSCYERAWEFSKCRSGLAQKHWGMHYFGRNDYENAVPHLQKSLEINSLQENLWLRFGFAALSLEKYELAASAYIRYTHLEPSGFESWNNLAKCFIKLGNKKRAHKVLQESIKCNYDNWKIWENFLLVSVDVGSFDDAINAYNRLIELKEKYFDEEILKIIINAIANNLMDADGNSSMRLKKKALEMLAHLGSLHGNEGVVWELSALLTDEPLKKAEKLQKAYKGYVLKYPDWQKSEEIGLKLLEVCRDLCQFSLDAGSNFKETEKLLILSQLSSSRLTAQGCVKICTKNDWESCKSLNESIEKLLEAIVIRIMELK